MKNFIQVEEQILRILRRRNLDTPLNINTYQYNLWINYEERFLAILGLINRGISNVFGEINKSRELTKS